MAGQVYNIPVIDTANRQSILSQGLRVGYFAQLSADFYWAVMDPGVQMAFYIEGGLYGFYVNNPNNSTITRYQALSATVTSVQTEDISRGVTEYGFNYQPNPLYIDVYPSKQAAYNAISGQGGVPISYVVSGCSAIGPESAVSGERVTINIALDSGKIIKNPAQGGSISVYNRSGYIPFAFGNNSISFTVP